MNFSIIMPTYGRCMEDGRLQVPLAISHILPQLAEGDEVLVVGDGHIEVAKQCVETINDPRIKYLDGPETHKWGNAQRQFAIPLAKGTHLAFFDDDNRVTTDCLEEYRKVIRNNPDRIVCAWMQHDTIIYGEKHKIEGGAIGEPMMIVPNISELLGNWNSDEYTTDFAFMRTTCELHKEPPIWIDKVLYHVRDL